MFKHKLTGLLIYFYTLLNGIPPDNPDFVPVSKHYLVTRIGKMPIIESSGFAHANEKGLFWTHADSGNKPWLYKIDMYGGLVDTLQLNFLKNIDWEDLAADDEGYIYIGDFGNNANARKNLVIHKISQQGEYLGAIYFDYADQSEFPPAKKQMNFDCEAFFWADGELHLFSKNRGDKCVKHYAIPDAPGYYTISPRSSIYLRAAITAADYHAESERFALFGYGKIYLFDFVGTEKIFEAPYGKVKFKRGGTAEALLYIDSNSLLLGNERGKLWQIMPKH
ncbi:MAG TPA: hypothetical protein PKC24_01410 [Cyclobacteriaceae bacterium]|nr:hypothetical protein [Cyclobacteriaceae bacterium]